MRTPWRLALGTLLSLLVAIQASPAGDLAARAAELRQRADWSGLLALSERALAASPEDAWALRERGRARLELQQWPAALRDLARAVELAPGDAEARFLLGWWYATDGKDLRATQEFDRALALDPRNAEYLYQRGNAKMRRNQLRAARADYMRALAIDARHAKAREGLADMDGRLGLQTTQAAIAAAAADLGPPPATPPARPPAAPAAQRPPAPPAAGGDPVATVRALLEAQARGDVEGLLALLATEGAEAKAVATARRGFEAVARRAQISSLQVSVRASKVGASGKTAIVRLAFTARIAAGGEAAEEASGALAVLVSTGRGWRVRAFHSDELLAIEGLGRQRRESSSWRLLPVVYADDVSWVKVEDLNRAIDKAVLTTVLDEQKLLYDSHFSAAGAIPGIGDVLSAGYTIWDRYKTLFHDLPQEYAEGNMEAVLADFGIVGWGVVQVLAEPIPVVDHVADGVGMALDQWKFNRSQRYAFLRLRGALLGFDYRAFPKYLVFRGFTGLPVNEQGLYELGRGPALGGKALQSFALLSDTPGRSGARASFEVGVEIRFLASESQALFEAARSLKVPVRAIAASAPSFKPDWAAYVPVRLSGQARDVAISGPQVALEPRYGDGVSWRFGCARGRETVRLVLADGTRTEPVVFENRVYDEVNGVRLRTREGRVLSEVSLRVGETLEGLEVVGVHRSGPVENPGPLLTGNPCCQVTLADPSIAELQTVGRWPEARLKISGRSAGASRLAIIVGTGSLDVEKVFAHVPVEVTGQATAAPRLEGEWQMSATVEHSNQPTPGQGQSGRARFYKGHLEFFGADEDGEQKWMDLGTYSSRVEGGRVKVLVAWFNPLTHDHQTWNFDLAPEPRGFAGTYTAVSAVGSDTLEMSGRVSFTR